MSQSTFLKAKVHRATVTYADLDYQGSLTLDTDLMSAAGLLPFERIEVYNCTNGERFATYLIPGEAGSGVVGINGAAAWKASNGDIVIIAAYATIDEREIPDHTVRLVFVDVENRMKECRTERVVPAQDSRAPRALATSAAL